MPNVSDSWWKRFKDYWFPDVVRELAKLPAFFSKLLNTLMRK
jgi:hypothetical protein